MIDVKSLLSECVRVWNEIGAPALLEQAVLLSGENFHPIPYPESMRGEEKQCFCNATKLVLEDPENLTYVEGFAVRRRLALPIHHAWCVNKSNQVIDPTWTKPEECSYFGIKIPQEILERRMIETGFYGVLTTGEIIDPDFLVELVPELSKFIEVSS
jgi:hypothetical protein